MRIGSLLFLLALPLAAAAQQVEKRPPTGTVTGHVYCADTNAPARMATVLLRPVEEKHEDGPHSSGTPAGGVVQTRLDGSFSLSDIAPGVYSLVVIKQGYISSRPDEAETDAAQPSPVTAPAQESGPKVVVEADQAANIDVRLERGAAITGAVHFDDGSPAAGLVVALLYKNKDRWVPTKAAFTGQDPTIRTDDLGQYRMSGLRSREYILQITLTRTDFIPAGKGRSLTMQGVRSSLMIYSGDAMRRSDATPFKLGAGEERGGEDITIPLSKLHTVSGIVTAASDGHSINRGSVRFAAPDDKVAVAEGQIEPDGTFQFECIPEGTYLVEVTNASDKELLEITLPFQNRSITTMDEKLIHKYGDLEQTIKVERDIPSLVLAVPEEEATPAAPQQPHPK